MEDFGTVEFGPLFVKNKSSSLKRERKISIFDIAGTALNTEHSDIDSSPTPSPEDSEDESVKEEEDIGEIAFDIATEAVDDISRVRKRVGKSIGKFKDERDKIMKKAKIKIDEKANSADFLRNVDKYTFWLAVPLVLFDFWALGRFSDYGTYNLHLFFVLSLIAWRHINYRYNYYHYYMVDF